MKSFSESNPLLAPHRSSAGRFWKRGSNEPRSPLPALPLRKALTPPQPHPHHPQHLQILHHPNNLQQSPTPPQKLFTGGHVSYPQRQGLCPPPCPQMPNPPQTWPTAPMIARRRVPSPRLLRLCPNRLFPCPQCRCARSPKRTTTASPRPAQPPRAVLPQVPEPQHDAEQEGEQQPPTMQAPQDIERVVSAAENVAKGISPESLSAVRLVV